MDAGLDDRQREAYDVVLAHRTMLLAYVRAIVRDPELAEDTVADVSMELVRSWERYDAARPFGPWARGVARHVALANLRKQRALPALLDAETLEGVGAELDALGDERRLEARRLALARCVEKLPEVQRGLVRMRYFEDRSYEQIAASVKRSVDALYVAFTRIHRALEECIRKQEDLS